MRILSSLTVAVLLAAVLGGAIAQGASPSTSVLLVLDASGSMYLRLDDGRYRITAAKEALSEFVSRLPDDPGLNVGLRVYGSQMRALDEGACEDSLLTVPVQGFDRDQLLRQVRDTQAQGATPIAYSLELAAEDLRDVEGRKLIVLVTDGEEGCLGDLRGVAERLAGEGLEIDIRIIGFALSDRAVQSFDGIGTFENTGSAAELAAALGRAVELAPVTETHTVTVTLTRRGQPATEGATVSFVDGVGGETYAFDAAGDGTFTVDLPAGSYRAEIMDAFASAELTVGGLSVAADAENAFTFELEPDVAVELTVTPTDPAAGSSVTVHFEGAPGGERNWLAIAPADGTDDVYLDWAPARGAAGEVNLRVPDEATTLEARYHLQLPEGGTRVVGRSEPFASRAVTASLDGPGEVGAGARFDVAWEGPGNDGDYVTIVPEGAGDTVYGSYFYTDRGSPETLTAPIEAGHYEIRYVTGQASAVLAHRPIVVTAVAASLSAPDEVGAGAAFEVSWQGPNNARDYVTIVPAGAPEGTYHDYAYTDRGDPAAITAPLDAGAYEIRYVTGQGDRTLASVPVTVVAAADVRVDPPASVTSGAPFDVAWSGPDNRGDYLTIVPEGAPERTYLDYAFTDRGSPATLTAPIDAGRYEVRYLAGQGDRTLASAPITVVAAEVRLDVPASVTAGASFSVAWTGPDNRGDYVTIVPAGAPERTYLDYAYTSSGSPATLTSPDEPGRYEVRYLAGQGDRTLASVTIDVR